MTEFPPSNQQESHQAPPESPRAEARGGLEVEAAPESPKETAVPHSTPADALAERLPARIPKLTTDGGVEDEPEDCPPIYDDAAWRRITPQGLYPRLVRPVLGGILLGFVLIPVVAVVGVLALANWIAFRDRSKVFFKQTRVGYRDQEFELWKFRTMRESPLSDYQSWVEGHEQERVTRFGSFLRRSHLDELPQIINVLKGEMSIIGPRPEMVDVNRRIQEELPRFYRRLAIRPGITGFAQITQGYAGNDIDAYSRKLEADLVYIRDLSLQLDLGILLVTPIWMLRLLGWKNDPAAHRIDDKDRDFLGGTVVGVIPRLYGTVAGVIPRPGDNGGEFLTGAGVVLPKPRPGNLSAEASRLREELEPIPPV